VEKPPKKVSELKSQTVPTSDHDSSKHAKLEGAHKEASPPRSPDSTSGGKREGPAGKSGASVSSIVSGNDEDVMSESMGGRLRTWSKMELTGPQSKVDIIKSRWFTDAEGGEERESAENRLAPFNLPSVNKSSDMHKLRRLSEMEGPTLEGLGIEAERERLRINQESVPVTNEHPNDDATDETNGDNSVKTQTRSSPVAEPEADFAHTKEEDMHHSSKSELKRSRDEEKEDGEPNPKRSRLSSNASNNEE